MSCAFCLRPYVGFCMQLVEQAVKLTTTASGQYAGAKRQIGEALCVLLLEKKQ